jgi:hypothetical protein
MKVIVHIPDSSAADLPGTDKDLSRKLLEAYAVEHYRSGELTAHQVKELLGLDTDLEVDGFLKAHGVPSEFTFEGLEREQAALDALLSE